MEIESKLKPLYANLKRLKIGNYLWSQEFKLYTIENDFDDLWKKCKDEVIKNKTVIALVPFHDTTDEETAFGYLMSDRYNNTYFSFHDFILPLLLNFAGWSNIKLDFTSIITELKKTDISKSNILNFTKDFRKIQVDKPDKLDEADNSDDSDDLLLNSRKIFVVHGKEDKSRLQLCNILKDDFHLDPIVLEEKPNKSIETIISKFERLASDCSGAIILFTPDDEAGENKRARQNVILELGYFLGKFRNTENRRIIILKKGNVEIPSDISGIIYLAYQKDIKEVFYDLKTQFEFWGY